MGNKNSKTSKRSSYSGAVSIPDRQQLLEQEESLFESNAKARKILEEEGTSLDLENSSLTFAPPSLCSRTELIELNLSLNPIRERFLNDMTQLVNLKTLELKSCALPVVPMSLRRMYSLTKLDLSNNSISASCGELRCLTNLEELYLNDCNIPNFRCIDSLVNLKTLELNRNRNLTGDISSIGFMSNLKNLSMSQCRISNFQMPTNNLLKLENLDLSYNKLSTLDEIENIPSLKRLDLDIHRDRNVKWDINGIGNLENLEELSLGFDDWKSLPASIGDMKNMMKLKIRCPLGILHPLLFNFQKLEEISFSSLSTVDLHNCFGCTVLRISEEEFDIKSLFPSLSEEMLESIQLKEAINLFPNLSGINSLRKIKYEISGFKHIEIIKQDGQWINENKEGELLSSISIEDEYTRPNNSPLFMIKNGVLIVLPRVMIQFINPSENKENIDIVEIISAELFYYILDTQRRIWKLPYQGNDNVPTLIDNTINAVHIMLIDGNTLFGIDDCNSVFKFSGQNSLVAEKLDVVSDVIQVFGDSMNTFFLHTNGQITRMSKDLETELITDLPFINYGTSYSFRYGEVLHYLLIDEEGNLWKSEMRGSSVIGQGWKLYETELKFFKARTYKNNIVFTTIQGEIIVVTTSDLVGNLIKGDLPIFPVQWNTSKYSSVKSARK